MTRNLIIKILRPFLSPFRSGSKNYYRARDIYYTNPAEHLHRLVHYIRNDKRDDLGRFEQILDIGAANGDTALFFAKNFPSKKVIAFEPNPNLHDHINEKFRHLKIELAPYALGEKKEKVELHITTDPLSTSVLNPDKKVDTRLSEQEVVQVEQMRLDDTPCADNKTLLLKIDTQGTELRIFKGGIKCLKNTLYIVCEMMNHKSYEGSSQYYELDEFLRGLGFELLDIIITYRGEKGIKEFDAIYINRTL